MNSVHRFLICLIVLTLLPTISVQAETYAEIIRNDEPVAWWRFDGSIDGRVVNAAGEGLSAVVHGGVRFNIEGPRPSEYPDFSKRNQAARFPLGPNYLVVTDPGDQSELDFTRGDALTLEAWIQLDQPQRGTYTYIIGKGRTHHPGTSTKNQNYSLRLANRGGQSYLSFFFVDSESGDVAGGIGSNGHRWTSSSAVPDDGGWHHVALTYTFGKADSVRCYIDADPVTGKWDMGGATDKAPVVDNDELWIGSSMQGRATLGAMLDEVAIYRKALTPVQIKKHVNIKWEDSLIALGRIPDEVPSDHVRVELTEGIPVARKWTFRAREPELLYETDRFALKQLPNKYNAQGLIVNRKIPSLLHLVSKVRLDAGEYEFLLRSLDAARLYIDGELVAETGFMSLRSDAHQPYYELPDFGPELLSIPAGHQEKRVTVKLEAGEHVFSLYRLVGNKNHGDYLGEIVVGVSREGGPFRFLSPVRSVPLTDGEWLTFLSEDRLRRRDWEQRQRFRLSRNEREYWERRHEWARSQAGPLVEVPQVPDGEFVHNDIDRFILARLEGEGLKPTSLTDDWAFLRRVCLDTLGTIPTPAQIDQFFRIPPEKRRAEMVDRLLEHPAWADHWVGYWQDVLAENPGLTKPELNNSGPFRWFLYESFLDNKPFDQFATELILMEGSPTSGGPAGFAIASQNDVPMAAKAHIIGTAFLAVEMKCARCHDAPYHDVTQKDLFSLAAALKRGPEKVPGSSSIPVASEAELASLAVKVTLPPGSSVKPEWPFAEWIASEDHKRTFPNAFIRHPGDSRENLAAMLTSPHNSRFARVIANRLWKRYLGRGLVEPVDDWETPEESHPELLDYLARELVLHDYDLKHLARIILNSHTYQRTPVPGLQETSQVAGFFRGPIRRRMTGEQLADSLYLAAGKDFGSEELTMDADGKRPDGSFGHFGIPVRAWEFVTVSNERDRPSMSLPVAQSVIDLMAAYGWRQQRQDPLTVREDPFTALQPMALANGTSSNRAIDFSDHSGLTALAIENQPVEVFVDDLFQRLLTRPPSSDEREVFIAMLRDGYANRVVAGPEAVQPRRIFRSGVTWGTHFAPESDVEAMDRQREILKGERPTDRLAADWRQRAEDVVWALVNSPEFVFVP